MSSSPLPLRLALATLLACSSMAIRPADATGRPPSENPHRVGHLVCSACHVIVGEPAPGGPDRLSLRLAIPGAEPAGPLLLQDDPVDLCLSCHDGQAGTPDVVGDDVNGLVDRSAGFFDAPGLPNPRGHTLAATSAAEMMARPGAATPMADAPMDGTVTCTDCHDPHGGTSPRLLRLPADSSATGLGLFVEPGAVDLQRFEASRVAYGTRDDAALREVTVVCRTCHSRCSATQNVDPDRDGKFEQHPSYDSVDGSRVTISAGSDHGITSSEHWLAGTGAGFTGAGRVPVVARGAADYAAASIRDAGRDAVFCLSCHKAHGSGVAFGLLWTPGRDHDQACAQCHPAGSPADRGSW